MQRITRHCFDSSDSQKINLLEQYNSLLSLLKSHLTERTFSVFAIPKLIEDDHYIAWSTNLEGQPILLSDINNELYRQTVTTTLQTRIIDIENTVKLMSLTPEQQTLVSFWIPRIKSLGNSIFVINDEPVIVHTFEDPVLPPKVPEPKLPTKSTWRWWSIFLLALLLLALIGGLWYVFYPFNKDSVDEASHVSAPVITPADEEKKPQLEPVDVPVQPEPEIKQDPKPVEHTETVVEEKKPEPEEKPKPKVKNPANCITKEELVSNPNPSKMVMVFDNSLSMIVTLAESPAEVEQYFQYLGYGFPRYMSEQDKLNYEKRMTRLPSRLSSSKKVALTSIDKIQQNINISLVTLTGCPSAEVSPFYSYKNRGTLKNKINKLTPTAAGGGGTPLYNGLEKASNMLDGVKRDDYILIISDGEDTCTHKNICTLAHHISVSKPRLKINIVDIAGEHKIDCVANATGGKVYIAQTPKDMIKQMNKAVSDMKINRPVCQ